MNLASLAAAAAAPIIEGRLVEALGLVLEAEGCHAAVGDRFEVVQEDRKSVV